MQVAINTPAVSRANHPKRTLFLAQAVDAYRHQYLEERGFGRLKGRLLALRPLYLSNPQRVTGLIRLLSLGLRVLTLVEFEVRRQLQIQHADLAGLYAGQPKRAPPHPTTERLLHAFKGLTLTLGRTVQRPLAWAVRQRTLRLAWVILPPGAQVSMVGHCVKQGMAAHESPPAINVPKHRPNRRGRSAHP